MVDNSAKEKNTKLVSEYILLICYSISRFSNTAIIIFTYWYVWEQTNSAKIVGLVGGVSGIAALSGLVTGLIVDKLNKNTLIISCDFFKFFVVLLLYLSIYIFGFTWLICCIALLIVGVLNQIYSPAVRTNMITVLGERRISSINGKLFTIEQLSIIGGASITGILILSMGVLFYLLISAMFLSSFILLLINNKISHHDQHERSSDSKSNTRYNFNLFISDFKSTYIFIYKNKVLLHTMPLILILFFCFSPFLVLLGIWSDVVLNKGAVGYSLMETFFPIGMMIGGILTTILVRKFDSRMVLSLSLFLAATMTLSFSLSKNLIISLALLTLLGVFISLANLSLVNIQTEIVPESLRGRYFATSQTFIGIVTPLGYTVSGFLTEYINIEFIFMSIGIVFVLVSMICYFLPSLKHYIMAQKSKELAQDG
ncbi:MFS transporter [Oceanobacillus sp. J11TS1]|uniref:MFS transporter n=1 Tax=Oceanobacillus sp. J11TS1 TaxID=2807191 RepID=UPI001B0E9649|nr:MFS transporter [Oceanobacillus sp. J11TS1]GIO25023.1 MFS transporter [Oceanobacillus sp. J11TS1]